MEVEASRARAAHPKPEVILPIPFPRSGSPTAVSRTGGSPGGSPRASQEPVASSSVQALPGGAELPARRPPRSGPDAAQLPPRAAELPLQPHQVQHAAYRAASARMGKAFGPIDGSRLVRATESVARAREELPFGRANVRPEIVATRGDSFLRILAARKEGPANAPESLAAAMALGAGNCGEHSAVAVIGHAPQMPTTDGVGNASIDYRISQLQLPEIDHALAVETGTLRDRGTGEKVGVLRPVVPDPWGRGPAVLWEDSTWKGHKQQVTMHLDAQSGGALKGRVEALKADFQDPASENHQRLASSLDALRDAALRQGGIHIDGNRFYDRSNAVVSQEFADAARKALLGSGESEDPRQMAWRQVVNEVGAAGAVREAYGRSIPFATHPEVVGAVLDAAVHLDRPPLTEPPAAAFLAAAVAGAGAAGPSAAADAPHGDHPGETPD